MKKKGKFNDILYDYYIIDNDKKCNTLILPGWQQNFETYKSLYETIGKYSNIYFIHFPGFKNTVEPIVPVDLNFYVSLVKDLIETLDIQNFLIYGHSFGGRVAIKYQALNHKAFYLILNSSAGIKKFKLINKLKILKYKIKKRIYKFFSKEKYNHLINNSGSKDYKELSSVMKETFKNIIDEDLKRYCKKISVPTLLIWGCNDKETPLKQGKIFKKKIKSSELVVLNNCGHFSFLENKFKFNLIIDAFYKNIWGNNY